MADRGERRREKNVPEGTPRPGGQEVPLRHGPERVGPGQGEVSDGLGLERRVGEELHQWRCQ